MPSCRSHPDWVSLLRSRADTLGARTALRFYPSGDGDSVALSYADLDAQARRIAGQLQARCAPGDRVLLLFPPGLEFVSAFFGCLYAGVVAVPAHPPRANETIHRLRAIVGDAGARVALTTRNLRIVAKDLAAGDPGGAGVDLLATDDAAASSPGEWTTLIPPPETLAMLQYTSGSTGKPKGVMLTHGNLLANQAMISSLLQSEGPEITAGWLPLFHDMGLIGVMMHALYSGGCSHLMPPAAFLQKPLRWLKLVSDVRATVSPAPNFAYDLCTRRITPAEIAQLDLSAWRCALNGSEPIHAATLERFAAAFAPAGFRRAHLVPSYGMAEASLLITGKPRDTAFVEERIAPEKLAAGIAVPVESPAARTLVSSGRAVAGMEVAVVGPRTRQRKADGEIGEIWVRGGSVGLGYWRKPAVNREAFGAHPAAETGAPWLRTGDLGYLRAGELFVTGRMKDVIIVRGRNLYPQDLEATAQGAHPALRAHGGAAFAVEHESTEGVVIVQEVERTALRTLDAPAVLAAIRAALVREHDIRPVAIVLVKPATVPKTSSGKVQRSTCRAKYLANEFEAIATRRAGESAAPFASLTPPRGGALRDWLVEKVAALLELPAAEIDPHAPLQSLGLDSLAAVTLSGELSDHLHRPVEPTIVYSHPTIAALTAHFSAETATPPAPAMPAGSPDDRAIAVIGLGCRFPGGAGDPAAFWNLLRRGGDATGEIPASRWAVDDYFDADPDAPGRMYVRRGAFLDGVEDFDPEFFGIAPREAAAIDPQHRLLLEIAWEALEDAGLAPDSAARAETGVFVGVSFDDYARRAAPPGNPGGIDPHAALGAVRPLAAARISYHLGLQGPSMIVDTLCSSSLLAVHLAMQSLRNRECRTALAGGVNLILDPGPTIATCKLRALAPDGRCKTFDAAADGYARGEGAGLVVLKRLADARADGDPILAVLRGSAVNHDGRSNGLTAPNGRAQEALLRRALADAGAAPDDVAYVETHGTGTVLGDPIEVQALDRVYGPGRTRDAALLLGAVKTNLGHLESAAGIAGLIKAVLALRHRELPANLHFKTPNPHIAWDRLAVRVLDRAMPWPAQGRLAGVSSFGLGGTNVHVLLEAAPAASPAPRAPDSPVHLLTISGRTPAAAVQNAGAWAACLAGNPGEVADLCFTANTGRAVFAHRAAVVGGSAAELAEQLRQLTPADFPAAPAVAPAVAFLFTGQGSQYAGMGRELYATHPGFRATLDECAQLFAGLLPRPLTEVLFGDEDPLLDRTLYAQPAIFSLQLALGRLWLGWGVRPAGLFGHSIGEYAAACLAGVFSLPDAVKLVAAKARLTHALPPGGAMLAATAPAAQLAPHLAAHPEIEIAAFNGPAATTLAGPAPTIARLLADLGRAGIGAQPLPIAQAFHSRALEPMLGEFARIAETVSYQAPQFPLVTCLEGSRTGAGPDTAGYWVRQMREPVQFARGLETLANELGCTVFLELGPKPTLTSLGPAVFPRTARTAQAWLPSLRPGRSDWSVLLAAAGRLFTRGVPLDWAGFEAGDARRRQPGLPTYAFQRQRYWLEAAVTKPVVAAPARAVAIPTFAVHWHEAVQPAAVRAAADWLLVANDPAFAAVLAPALAARHQRMRTLEAVPADFNPAGVRGVIYAGPPAGAVALARKLIDPALPPTRLWIVTRQAVATGREQGALDLMASPLAGFARAFALEHPAHWGALLDFDEFTPPAAAALADELLAGSTDDLVAWRKHTRLVPRLLPHALGASEAPPLAGDKTHLITGGTGGLGLAVAHWLVARGVRHLSLMSRREPGEAARRALAGLAETGVDVRVRRGDVTVAADVARVLAEIAADQPSLGGVFHAAGVAGFTPLAQLSAEEFGAVQAPKVAGARHLHELTRGHALDHFVLFSSIASVWGSQGQTHYAAGNAYLDTLAHERRRLGLPALSVNWGPWSDAGMAASPAARDQLQRIGLTPLAPAAAVDLLGRLMANGEVQVAAAEVDWSRLHPVLALRRPQPLLAAFADAPAPAKRPVTPRTDILARLRAADATQRDALLAAHLRTALARVLGHPTEAPIEPQRGFFSLGMDSLMAVELRTQLETDLEVKLPATIAFDRATLAALQDELARQLFARLAEPVVASPSATASAPGAPIAIIGLGCRFPGGVTDPAGFWELLRAGRHGITPVPAERWPASYYHPDPDHAGTSYARGAGFIDGVDQFDHAFFDLFPREAATMDPQQRLLLETAWHALESAGLANAGLRGSATGTFVGVSNSDYAHLLLKSGDPARIDAYFGTGNALNAVAGRVAYTFGLRGPAMVTDTACSSSLVALHQACQSLRAGECVQAIAAGVNLLLAPEPGIALARARMLAADGHCKSFDASADGYGRGEGCGVVILKRLADAQAAGDTVLAVIAGSAVNQDGASSGFTVPSGAAQQELIRRALAQAGRTPDELDYVEAHGTGTPLGDPIEINALAAVVGRTRRRPLLVGSVKTNLGHLESAAGIAGVIKTVLALRHAVIPAHIGFTRPSPHIAWTELPVQVPVGSTEWPAVAGRPRLAGVSAFGFTGTNAHVILESVPALPAPVGAAPAPAWCFPLSARTPAALVATRRAVLAWLEANPGLAPADVARTLGAGRRHFALREACVDRDLAGLRAQLAARLSAEAPAAATPRPLAFGCDSLAALGHGEQWLRLGLAPAGVVGAGSGLLAAGALAGIFSAADAARLAVDPALLGEIKPSPPRLSFGHRRLGRIADATAASVAWWRLALSDESKLAPGEPWAAHQELALVAPPDASALADLYCAGHDLDWAAATPGGRHRPEAPGYPFQRRRHWIDTTPAAAPAARPRADGDAAALLGTRLALPGAKEIRFATEYSHRNGFIAHHRIFGRMIASGAQHVALLIAATRATLKAEACTVSDVAFVRALMLSEGESRAVQLVLEPTADGALAARVLSQPPVGDEWLTHATGHAAAGAVVEAGPWAPLPPDAIATTGAEFQRLLDENGYTLGPSFRWVQSVRSGGGRAEATLAPAPGAGEPHDHALHPGLIDSCFQLLGWAAGVDATELSGGNAIYIPAKIDRVRFHRRASGRPLRCAVRITGGDHHRTHKLRGDLRLMEEDGNPVFEVTGFEARRAARSVILTDQTAAPAGHFYQLDWIETAAAPTGMAPAVWSLLGGGSLADALAARLRARGHVAELVEAPADNAERVVLLLPDVTGRPDEADTAGAARLLALVQQLADRPGAPRLWVVTRGAQALPGDRMPARGDAAVVGLGRIAALEHPALRVTLVDLDPAAPAGEDTTLERALLADDDENQNALRDARRLAARLVPAALTRPPDGAPQKLVIGGYGNLDTLTLQPAARRALAPGEIEIEVRAAGLNFRDVLGALGMLQPHLATLGVKTAADLPLGGECAGVIRAVGSAVTRFQPGDEVVTGLAPGSLASHVVVEARLVAPKPAQLGWAEAATLPVAYLTAYHALHALATVQPGERVLIHAAAGGVGLAAVHVARLLGAEVLATASPAKWPALRALGVTILGHSRHTDYAKEFPPVDVVLNALVGDHIPASLGLLKPGGRFVEIGKLGIWTPGQVAAQRADVQYFTFDLLELDRHDPHVIGRRLAELAPHWAAGRLPPLPLQVFPLTEAPAAFRFMAQARHVGKVVLTRPAPSPGLRRDGVYLITGGLGGLGLAVAGWLARHGAGTIVLSGRRPPDAAQEKSLDALRAAGARVIFLPADLSQPAAAAALVQRCVEAGGALRGVFHAAGAVDDGLIRQQTPARLEAVFAPKARAAWALHTATRAQPLDHFVLFSSLAAVLGSPGQATYAAANAALDALAQHRQRLGRPALSVNWGPWAEAGMSARLGERERARFAALGLKPFGLEAGVEVLADLLGAANAQVAAVDLDRAALLGAFAGRMPPLLRQLAGGTQATATGQRVMQLRAAPAADRAGLVLAALTTRLTTSLGLAAGESLATDRDLTSLGFDSLAAVELQGWVNGEFGVEVPMQKIAGFTLAGLARFILAGLGLEAAAAAGTAPSIEETMRADAQLPADLQPAGPAPELAEPRAALLTGATGFLGAFLLHELITTTTAVVHCLVRCQDAADGRRRLLDNLRGYGLPTEIPAERLVVVPGDLAEPQLGLDDAAWARLAGAVEAIYHNGAWLNFFYPYAALRAANVQGTLEVIRLALQGRPKPVHYVSTSGVFYSRRYRGQALPETDAAEHCAGHALGYSQSKWVAERLVAAAGERGLPVTIHRAPFITGHGGTGAWNRDDFICRLVRGIIALGAMPDLAATMDIVPVDYVAGGVVWLSRQPASAGRRFHLCAAEAVPWAALAGWLAEAGYPVRPEPYADWLARLPALRGTDHPLAPFVPLFLEKGGADQLTVPEVFLQSAHARLDGAVTARALAAAGRPAPPIDGALWRRYLERLRAAGALPPP